ncbi:GIY-YIG nuclease family protein [Luteimonas suaedae]|uniref:GIY-YIG nuclease family protein n=1 Tax=Luteimonas suaedae TaxID=2605430 RepID=UPI001658FCB6|nr:GIY-YIG nuclease family protein [Luteimonas suaedae]
MSPGTCYLYVLPLAGEDLLKIGIASDPLARAQAFSRRYYESFDLSRSLLVEFDSRREAQARETGLHRRLREWNAPQPITVPLRAAGRTEWYRGAYAELEAEVAADRARGHVVHQATLDWWRHRLQRERDTLYEWAAQLQRDVEDGYGSPERMQLLADALDAWPGMGLPLHDALPPELKRWYARYRAGWRTGL